MPESGLIHNCCVKTDVLNPELLSRLKMTHPSSLTWFKFLLCSNRQQKIDLRHIIFWLCFVWTQKNKDYIYNLYCQSKSDYLCIQLEPKKQNDWLPKCVSLLFRSDLCIPWQFWVSRILLVYNKKTSDIFMFCKMWKHDISKKTRPNLIIALWQKRSSCDFFGVFALVKSGF